MKYKLIDETIVVGGKTLYRIEAVTDFSNIRKGDRGGFVESKKNLSQNGNAWVCGKAWVDKSGAILWIGGIGSRLDTTTAYADKDGGVSVKCGCFCGTLNDFLKQVENTHGDNNYGKEYRALIELIKIHFDVEVEK